MMRLGNYLLLDRLNQGGMADVYLAKSFGYHGADQILALKCIRPEIAEDPVFVRMFIDEAKLAVLLVHANIAQTYEFGRIGSTYFMALEYLSGCNVRELIERARLRGESIPEPLVLHIMAKVSEGLDYAHRKTDPTGVPLNIVHRDVSPQNVLISFNGDVKVIDFGIAKAANQVSRSQAGVLKGKYGYMSPEQVRGLPVDARSDVFAAGVVFWELLTGERLFPGGSDFSVLEKVRHGEIYPPSLVSPTLTPEVEAVVMQALARDLDQRCASASDLHDAIVALILAKYGPPSARDLAALVQRLFDKEQQAAQKMLDEARRHSELPAEAVPLAPLSAPPSPAEARGGTPPRRLEDASTRRGSKLARVKERPAAEREPPGPPPVTEDTPVSGPPSAAIAESSGGVTAPAPPPRSVIDFGLAHPTAVRRALATQPRRRDVMIVLASVAVALGLISFTFWWTRPAPSPERGGVIVLSVPEAAEVLIDGVQVGETPFSSASLTAGPHQVTVRKAGWLPETRELRIVSHKVIELRITMQPVP